MAFAGEHARAGASDAVSNSGDGAGQEVVGVPQLLPEQQQHGMSKGPPALWEMELRGRRVSCRPALERWALAYRQMALDAENMGVPRAAIPPLPPNPSEQDIHTARDLLGGIIDSFLSSAL